MQQENEKKKEYLMQYRRAIRREQDILDEIQRLRADKMFPSIVNDGMPGGSGHGDLSDFAVLMEEQIELLRKERLKKAQLRKEIEKQIRLLEDDRERDVLWYRYIVGLKWEDIAERMRYCYQHIHKIHGSALKNFKMR